MSIEESRLPGIPAASDRTEDGTASPDVVLQPSNVLSFPSAAIKRNSKAEAVSVFSELHALLEIHDHLIALLRETDNDGLDMLTDSMVVSVVNCRTTLAEGCNEAEVLKMTTELRAGLRETPRTLRALLPGLGPRLGESLEHRLGIQFSSC